VPQGLQRLLGFAEQIDFHGCLWNDGFFAAWMFKVKKNA
jgi:hypothetical protein